MNCRRNSALLAFVTALLICDGAFAAPGQNIYRWEPPVYDSAAMAVIMKQLDDGTGAFSKNSGGGNSGTTLVCGGGSSGTSASASANSSCIILNNSTGDITTGQNSDGNQSATANSKTSTSSSISDALSALVPGGQ